jgi:FixH
MTFGLSPAQRWPTIITVVLLVQIGFGIWMARLAGSDPHHAVEPDYYQRAANWDSTMAQARRDRASGVHVTATLSRRGGQGATLDVVLTDSLGARIAVDSIAVDAFAIAHASRIERPALTATPDSVYRDAIVTAGSGLWEVRLHTLRAGAVFTAIVRTDLP